MRGKRTVRDDGYIHTIDVTADDLDHEYILSDEHVSLARDRGVTEMRMNYWAGWWGRLMLQKEVGPPPWKVPHFYFDLSRSPKGSRSIRVGIGWRSTLYTAMYMAKPHRSNSGN